MRHRHPSPGNLSLWLWVLAVLIAAVGASLAYVIYPDVDIRFSRSLFNGVIAIFSALSLLCVICATANWWVRH